MNVNHFDVSNFYFNAFTPEQILVKHFDGKFLLDLFELNIDTHTHTHNRQARGNARTINQLAKNKFYFLHSINKLTKLTKTLLIGKPTNQPINQASKQQTHKFAHKSKFFYGKIL